MKLKIIAAIAAFFLAFAFGFAIEHLRMDSKLKAYKLKVSTEQGAANESARVTEQAMQKSSDGQSVIISKDITKAKAKERIIIEEVIRYVKNPDNGKCVLNNEWVRSHNHAAKVSIDTGAASGADDKARTITDSDALIVVTKNYAICQERLVRLEGWQNWYKGIKDAN